MTISEAAAKKRREHIDVQYQHQIETHIRSFDKTLLASMKHKLEQQTAKCASLQDAIALQKKKFEKILNGMYFLQVWKFKDCF